MRRQPLFGTANPAATKSDCLLIDGPIAGRPVVLRARSTGRPLGRAWSTGRSRGGAMVSRSVDGAGAGHWCCARSRGGVWCRVRCRSAAYYLRMAGQVGSALAVVAVLIALAAAVLAVVRLR